MLELNSSNYLEQIIQLFGKEKFRPVLNELGIFLVHDLAQIKKLKCQIITIAGTNGKGQVAFELAELLRSKKITYCRWTSPHLVSVTERFHHDGKNIAWSELIEITQEQLERLEKTSLNLSFYEFLFGCFIQYVLRHQPQVLILEVGLGGRWDAVNLLEADIACITSISRDHQEILGHRLEQILAEKYAVTRKGKTLITALGPNYLQNRVAKWSAHDGVDWIDLYQQKILEKSDDFSILNQMLGHTILAKMTSQPLPTPKLKSILRKRPLTLKTHQNGEQELAFIGSHNVDGIRKLVLYLAQETYNNPIYDVCAVAFSQRGRNDLDVMLKIFKQYNSSFKKMVLVSEKFHKALPEATIRDLGKQHQIEICTDWRKLLTKSQPQKILFTGSNYFIGHLLQQLHYRDSASTS
ncbi:MAG: hypothetical protein JNM93_05525 [Bacteriovoracaceae bacterium]|nr:hypothetical protein [Bacteriovoracaceae bacterium]